MYEMLRAFVFCHIERSRNMNKKHSFQRPKNQWIRARLQKY